MSRPATDVHHMVDYLKKGYQALYDLTEYCKLKLQTKTANLLLHLKTAVLLVV